MDPLWSLTETIIKSKGVQFQSVGAANQQLPLIPQTFVALRHQSLALASERKNEAPHAPAPGGDRWMNTVPLEML